MAPEVIPTPLSVSDPRVMHRTVRNGSLLDALGGVLQRGLADVAFLGGAQIDQFANVNSTVIGDYERRVLARVVTEKPDLILLDVMMSVMDGFEVLRILKGQEATKDIPVIMLTARSQEQDVEQGLKLLATDYVVKPFSFPELMARIEGALKRKG